VAVLNLVQAKERGAAGEAQAVGSFRSGTASSISCTLSQTKRSGGAQEENKVEGDQKVVAASPGGAEIGRRCLQMCGDPS
jgi:hypothetical protein